MKKKKPTRHERDEEKRRNRLRIIGPLLPLVEDTKENIKKRRRLFRVIAQESGCSIKTIKRWFYRYKNEDLAGLLPKYPVIRLTGSLPQKHPEAFERACIIRETELASVKDIILTIESEGLVQKGEIAPSTLQRNFQKKGLATRRLKHAASGHRGALEDGEFYMRYQAKGPFAVLYADITYGPGGGKVIDEAGEPVRPYVSAYIDDYSRYVWLKVCTKQDQDSVSLLLRQIIEERNMQPVLLITDNGSVYTSQEFQNTCAVCGMKLVHCRIRSPHQKGKQERIFIDLDRAVDAPLANSAAPITLSAYESLCMHWAYKHNHSPHSALNNRTPAEVLEQDKPQGIPAPAAGILDYAFSSYTSRTVSPDASVSVNNVKYKVNVNGMHRGDQVDLRLIKESDGSVRVMQRLGNSGEEELKPLEPVDILSLKSINGKAVEKPETTAHRQEYASTLVTLYRQMFIANKIYRGEEDLMMHIRMFLTDEKAKRLLAALEGAQSSGSAADIADAVKLPDLVELMNRGKQND